MKILGIETSCDETAVAVLEISPRQARGEEITILSNVISSQVKLHAKYGGVVPALAAREHVKNIKHVFNLALKEAKIKSFGEEINLIAVTRGPGLGPALLVGITFARTMAWIHKKHLVGVNHLEGHIHSNWLSGEKMTNIFPALNLIVSGGHTELVLMKNHSQYKIAGETLDDAVGEAFDKVARLLGLGYPGGPSVAQRATEFKVESSKFKIEFPRPMIKSKNYNFSFSGLKTAVLYKVRDLINYGIRISPAVVSEICYEFQKAAIDVLVKKTMRATKEFGVKSILLSGGVSANKLLREELHKNTAKAGIKYFQPPMEYTTDNAVMIAIAGYFTYLKNKKTDYKSVKMDANLSV